MHGRKRVLVLDFDTELLTTLQRTLEDSGFNTFITWSVADANDMLATHYFDFFVVGNRPPKLNARVVIQDLRERNIDCGCYVIGAGRAQKDDFSRLLDCIRAYPCSSHNADEYPMNNGRADEELMGVGIAN